MNERQFSARRAEQGYGGPQMGAYEARLPNDEHSHDFAFAALVLEGELILTTREGSTTLGPGDMWALEANVHHGGRVVRDTVVRFLYGLKE